MDEKPEKLGKLGKENQLALELLLYLEQVHKLLSLHWCGHFRSLWTKQLEVVVAPGLCQSREQKALLKPISNSAAAS